MTPPTLGELKDFIHQSRRGSAGSAFNDAQLQRCLDTAVEYVEAHTGPLDQRETKTNMCTTAILIVAAHEHGVEQGSAPSGMPGVGGELVVGPGGYLIPNRAKSLIDAMWGDMPESIGLA